MGLNRTQRRHPERKAPEPEKPAQFVMGPGGVPDLGRKAVQQSVTIAKDSTGKDIALPNVAVVNLSAPVVQLIGDIVISAVRQALEERFGEEDPIELPGSKLVVAS